MSKPTQTQPTQTKPPVPLNKYDILYFPHVVTAYVDRLPPKERKAYEIAKSHLGCSYQTEKSVHYEKWLNKVVTKINKVVRGFIARRIVRLTVRLTARQANKTQTKLLESPPTPPPPTPTQIKKIVKIVRRKV